MALEEHRRHKPVVRCAILTVSDTRTPDTDDSGRVARELLSGQGHEISDHRIAANDAAAISASLRELLAGAADLVLTIGGTGVSKKDLTVDAASPFLARILPGFGELFRYYSLSDIGSAVILSRALMGVTAQGKLVVCTPGSIAAVRLALEKILLKELGHLIGELRK